MKTSFLKIIVGLALLTVFGGASAQAAEKEINLGIISTESSQNLRQIWEPLLDDMSAKTGLTFKPFFATDYAGVIEAMRFGKVDIAWVGNKAAMEAVDRANAEIFVQTVSADGSEGYYSHLITHVDAPLNSLEDVLKNSKNLTFGNGDPNSTSGFLVPSYYVFALNNVDPKTAFKRAVNASHETNALSVANKQVDVATNNSENLDRLVKTAPDKKKLIKVIWTSPLIPSDPLIWRKDLDGAVKSVVKDFMLNYGRGGEAKEIKILADLGWKGFKNSDDNQLKPIRQLELFKEKTKLENDSTMEAGQKQAKLQDVERRLKELE
ncbi:MAG: phosphonate ABC transporter substrate-binding protein [Candidatus Adiutrix sp.]|jgi:phosphonate transport system substrate-binding protein|nr:phosphonate ABC transporter substrate-binding protein [Candidatus Adiutrix sp.]